MWIGPSEEKNRKNKIDNLFLKKFIFLEKQISIAIDIIRREKPNFKKKCLYIQQMKLPGLKNKKIKKTFL